MKKNQTLCITPLNHIANVKRRLSKVTKLIYRPDIDSEKRLREVLIEKNIDSIFTNPNKQNFKITERSLKGTNVKLINTASTGLNHIELEDCRRLDIDVFSLTKDYEIIRNLPSTAELGFGLLLSLIRKIPDSSNSVSRGEWDYEPYVGRQLSGMTAGIIGYGRLGTFMARYCHAFGMKVLVNDPFKNVFDYDQVSKDELYERSDVMSLHVHVKEDTIDMIDKISISKMKKKPIIINTSRGEIVKERDLVDGIKKGNISGYGTDVLVDEFNFSNPENVKNNNIVNLMNNDYNVIVTPHIGGMSIEGQTKAYMHAVDKFTMTRR